TLRRYPLPPMGAPPAPPRIEGITYDVSIAGFPPGPGDPITFYCVARDPEGDSVTVTLGARWLHRPLRSVTRTFVAGASSSEAGAEVALGATAGNPPIADVTCTATDSHGLAATQVIHIP